MGAVMLGLGEPVLALARSYVIQNPPRWRAPVPAFSSFAIREHVWRGEHPTLSPAAACPAPVLWRVPAPSLASQSSGTCLRRCGPGPGGRSHPGHLGRTTKGAWGAVRPPCSAWRDPGFPGGLGHPGHPGCTPSNGLGLPSPPCTAWRDPGSPGGRGHPGLPGCTPLKRLATACPWCRNWCDPGSPGGRSRPGLPWRTPSNGQGLSSPC